MTLFLLLLIRNLCIFWAGGWGKKDVFLQFFFVPMAVFVPFLNGNEEEIV
jgi:hypothetical protein